MCNMRPLCLTVGGSLPREIFSRADCASTCEQSLIKVLYFPSQTRGVWVSLFTEKKKKKREMENVP